jgi:hypothetical protein
MTVLRPVLCYLAAAVVGTNAQAQPSARRDGPPLRLPTSEIFAAIARADTAALRPLLGDDLRWVLGSSGAVVEKPQLLAAASRTAPHVSLAYEIDSVSTARHGDVATAEYRLTNRRTFREYRNVFVSRASDVFVLRRGRWEMVRHTQTWLVRPPATIALDSAALAPFVGRYDRGAGYVDDVHFLDGHLVAQSTLEALMGAPGAHLHPVSANTFSPELSAPMIVFERDVRGRVTGYVQQTPDGTIARARRLDVR